MPLPNPKSHWERVSLTKSLSSQRQGQQDQGGERRMVSLRTPRAETTAEKLLGQTLLRDTCTLLRGRSPEAWSHLRLCPCSSSGGSSVNPTARCRQQERKGKCKTSSTFFLVGGFLSGHSEVKLAHSSSSQAGRELHHLHPSSAAPALTSSLLPSST